MSSWEYPIVPLDQAAKIKKKSADLRPEHLNELAAQGREAVALTLTQGDQIAWPAVPLNRPAERPSARTLTRRRARFAPRQPRETRASTRRIRRRRLPA
jgi:hypothetical protein